MQQVCDLLKAPQYTELSEETGTSWSPQNLAFARQRVPHSAKRLSFFLPLGGAVALPLRIFSSTHSLALALMLASSSFSEEERDEDEEESKD